MRKGDTSSGNRFVIGLTLLGLLAAAMVLFTGSDVGPQVVVEARSAPEAAMQTWTSELRPQDGSERHGTAILTAVDPRRTTVEVTLSGGGERLPAHVHVGPCGSLDPRPRFALAEVQNGKSDTILPVPLQQLLSGKFSIRVEAVQGATAVACGELVGG